MSALDGSIVVHAGRWEELMCREAEEIRHRIARLAGQGDVAADRGTIAACCPARRARTGRPYTALQFKTGASLLWRLQHPAQPDIECQSDPLESGDVYVRILHQGREQASWLCRDGRDARRSAGAVKRALIARGWINAL